MTLNFGFAIGANAPALDDVTSERQLRRLGAA
jgi:hypothetical protein